MRELLPLLPKPSRYIGIEEGSVHKNRQDVAVHCALAFPDMYEVGMSYLGHKILYGILNEQKHVWAERVFTPCRDAGAILKEHGVSLATMESDTPLGELHLVGFAITHELCYTNMLYMLDLAGIPLRTADRGDDLNAWPIVCAGGGCATSAEPMAPFMDCMMLGEGEEVMLELVDLLAKARAKGWTRSAFLMEASHIHGIYVPSFFEDMPDGSAPKPLYDHHQGAVRRVVANLADARYPAAQIVPFGAVHNRLSLEIARGCTRGCRFCQAGMTYRPARERKVEDIQVLLEECLDRTGYDDVSFLSLSTGDFSALKGLFMQTMDRCSEEQISVSLPSLRVGSIDDDIMNRMAGIRRTGATLAPEAGSQRLRDVINKGVTEEGLILHIRKLYEHGWQQVKLYFMIGLPTETYEDLDAIVELCRKARDAAGRGMKRLQITAAVSPFVPKPHTPFQWEAQIPMDEITARVNYLRTAMRAEKCMKLRWHEPASSHLEGIFSRGDRRLANVVESAYRKGAIFASWMDSFTLEPWLEAMAEHKLDPAHYIGERGLDEVLPWAHLDSGVSNEFLLRERKHALDMKLTGDCRYEKCNMCGICDIKGQTSRLEKLPHSATYTNDLNLPQRDQETHTAPVDEYGMLICRDASSSKPPALSKELIHKASQYRIWYTKEGSAVFLSQLELQTIFERALRRANLPPTFSQGFHPLPLLSFGRALPVGVASRAEWFSIILRERFSADEVRRRLQGRLPRGMQVTFVEEQIPTKKHAQAVTETYTINLIGNDEQKQAFAEAWRAMDACDSRKLTRETKRGGERVDDIRKLMHRITIEPDNSITVIFDWSDLYISPMALTRVVYPSAAINEIDMLKTEQRFV